MTKSSCLYILLSLLALLSTTANCSSPDLVTPQPFRSSQDNNLAQRWLVSTLAHDGSLPFSFEYDGKPSLRFLSVWKRHHTTTKLDAQRTQEEYVYNDPKTGLSVRCLAVRYSDFPAVEWTVYFQNKGPVDTPILSSIQALDLRLRPKSSSDFTLHYNTGSHAGADDFQPQAAPLTSKMDLHLGGSSGWSTTEVLSYFNLASPETSVLVGIGWPGNWKARFTHDADNDLHILAGQGVTHFVLHPGEEARSPLIALQFYRGDWLRGQNQWRRWMLAYNLPRVHSQLPPPILASAAPEIDKLHYNTDNEVRAMDTDMRAKMPIDHWWIDAGWYPCINNDWYQVGTWKEDKTQFPTGLRTVTDHARSLGLKQVLWFEPERVTPGTDLDLHHSEWLIKLPGTDNRLFNFGIPAAREFMTDLISRRITEYGVDLYRQDFNFDPLPYWRSQDAPDRQGMTEIKYVEGFLAFWDGLRERHQGMFIDACASGGRRNDLEILRRAIPLLQSDYRFEPNGTQGNNYGIALWIPYHGTGGPDHYGAEATYLYRSHMAPCHAYGPDRGDPHMDYALLNKLAHEEKQVQPYYFGDYYPLTAWSLDSKVWMGWQYDRPDLYSGIVQAFRRPENGEVSKTFRLSGLIAKSIYRIHNYDTGQDTTRTGTELMNVGLTICLRNKPGSALLIYHRQEHK